ncbi:MAG: hypothetical protein IJA15_00910 [Clostridia bacterium]|nr:hypothetical protein [Clostridia bacterium]
MKRIEEFNRIGVEKSRSYYIPFSVNDKFVFKHKILDRSASSRFISLNGIWKIKEHKCFNSVDIGEKLSNTIPVPSCVQLHGYDHIQYINCRYPFPVRPPYVPNENPTYHYRKSFKISDLSERYYLNFEGVDSCFYVYVNGKEAGYSQISHATSEFDITDFLKRGNNVLDVVVLKWCASSYLECQDKFRFTGIFRSVYLLKRPKKHITDFKITTQIDGNDGLIEVDNYSDISFEVIICNKKYSVLPNTSITHRIKNAKFWTAECPHLYNVLLLSNGEKILQRIGIRTSKIVNGIYLINGKHLKLKGVNRHESNPITGATVTVEDTIKDLKLMKWAKVNAIRTSHYPDIPEFYELCDAYGFYVMNEADLETHGAVTSTGGWDLDTWEEYANNDLFVGGITDRQITLYERDKNHSCVIIWSLGNESSFGKAFYPGIEYIRARDSRPIHYEGVWNIQDREAYYNANIDMVSRMYAEPSFFDEYLLDSREKRPYVLCEYSHAMGNSCGDLQDYWDKINSNDRFMGAFVWEWCDHAIKTDKGFLYGGDFGEKEHDSNFCADGLVSPDRKIKSNLLELRAVYGDKPRCDYVPEQKVLATLTTDNSICYKINELGQLCSVGTSKLKKPFTINIERAFIDNDMLLFHPSAEVRKIKDNWGFYEDCSQKLYSIEKSNSVVKIWGGIEKNCFSPMLTFELNYSFFKNGVDIELSYKAAKYVTYLPRIGFEFAIDKKYKDIEYTAYGPHESYIDKHRASDYGNYNSTVDKEYFHWVKPQETGSHYATTELKLANGMQITAEKPFSFSVLPYSTNQIKNAKHDFELPKSDAVYVNLDLAMSGIGTFSCGPELAEQYRAPRGGKNKFRIILNNKS